MVRARKIPTGQQYGKAKQQEEMIAASEGAAINQPLPALPQPKPAPVGIREPSQRPNEPISTPRVGRPVAPVQEQATVFQRRAALNLLPLLESVASQPFSTPESRALARNVRRFVGDMSELVVKEEEEA